MWRFLDLDMIDGFYSAAVFEAIGNHVGGGSSPETILFWRVRSPVVYLGYHQCVEDEINVNFCRDGGIGIVRRILGGGCGFCNDEQILFSIIGRDDGVIPHDIQEAYNKVLGGVVNALVSLGAGGEIEPARNAVYSHGRKISGNAQGRFGGAVLVNGSLLLDFDFELMDKALKNPTKNLHHVASAREGMITLRELGIIDMDAVKNSLRQGFENALGVSTCEGTLTESENEQAAVLLEKYVLNDWIYKMDNKRTMRGKKILTELTKVQ